MKRIISLFLAILLCFSLCALSSEDLLSAMMSSNPAIRGAKEQVNQALLDVKDAKAGYSPKIDLLVTGSYIANPIDPIRVNLGDYIDTSLYGVHNDYMTLYPGQESMYYSFSLELTQPLFTWGKLSKAVDLYQNIYQARTLQLTDSIEQAQVELMTRTAALHYLLQLRDVLLQQKELTERLVSIADEAMSNGMMLATDALAVKVQARQLDVAYANVTKQISLMLTELRNLTGLDELGESDIEFDESAFEAKCAQLSSMDYGTLSAKALSDSRTTFSLLGKLSEIAQLTRGIAGASVNWKPDVALVVKSDYSGSRLPFAETDWYGKDDWSATVTIAVKTTVFDGGKAIRNLNRTDSQVSQAEIDVQSAKAKVRSALDENWTNLAVYQSQMDYQMALAEQLDASNDVGRRLLDTGYGSESDYLQGLLSRNNCEIEILQTRISLAASVFTLLYLEGEGASL